MRVPGRTFPADGDNKIIFDVWHGHSRPMSAFRVKLTERGWVGEVAIDPIHGTFQRAIVGNPARIRSEKSGPPSAASAAVLIRERRLSSSKGNVVSTLPE